MNLEALRKAMDRLEKDGFLKDPKKFLEIEIYNGNMVDKSYKYADYVEGVGIYMLERVAKELEIELPRLGSDRYCYSLKSDDLGIIKEIVEKIECLLDIASSFR